VLLAPESGTQKNRPNVPRQFRFIAGVQGIEVWIGNDVLGLILRNTGTGLSIPRMSSDQHKDPIAEQISKAKERRKAEADLAAGERNLVGDFQRQADRSGPGEVAKIEALLAARCETINADKDADDPEFQYNAATHELRAGKFAVYLELTEGFSPYRLDMVSGLPRNAAQEFDFDFLPEYEPTNWRLLAHMDDGGFFWECDGERLSSEQVVKQGLGALAENVAR
jgi:hypothetical protein